MKTENIPKEESDAISNAFYYRIRNIIKEHLNYSEDDLDMQTFLHLLKETEFKPKDYFKMFQNLPNDAKLKILKKLNLKTEDELKAVFKKKLNVFNQSRYEE